MSAVLRKKIEAGAGVPPSILQLQQFWLQLRARTREWAKDTYGGEVDAILGACRVVNGKVAQQLLDGETAFYFADTASPGLSAVAIDNAGAIRHAAVRMHQDADSITDASPLFLKLLAEQAALSLWRMIAGDVLHTSVDGLSPLVDPGSADGPFDPADRFLLVECRLQFGEDLSKVWYAFPFEFMLQYARDCARRAADQKAQARHHSQKALSDSVLASTLPLDAVLERLTLTIGECSRLEVGSILPLADADAAKLSLSADTINGRVDIGSGELGVWKRQRAVRLNTPISDSFAQEMADL